MINGYVAIEEEISDLHKKIYRFWFDFNGGVIHSDEYSNLKRKTKRHKFRSVEYWSRLYPRESSYRFACGEELPEFPKKVIKQAKEKIKAEIDSFKFESPKPNKSKEAGWKL